MVERGEYVVRTGEASDALYLICQGKAEVSRNAGDPPIRLRAGDCFGEIGLLTGSPRTADVRALSRLRLLRLDRATYLNHVKELDQVERLLTTLALERAVRHFKPDGNGHP